MKLERLAEGWVELYNTMYSEIHVVFAIYFLKLYLDFY